MPSNPIDLPPEIALAFMRDLRAYHRTKNGDKRTLYVARQAEALSRHAGTVVKMDEVKELFRKMRNSL